MWKSNSFYEGEWRDDKISGKGKYSHANGDVYIGEFLNGLANGNGEYVYSKGSKYIGDWKDDM